MANDCYLPVNVKLASRAGWILKDEGVSVRVVPSPPDVDPECGFSLVFPCTELERVTGILEEAGIEHKEPVKRED